jgi:hypothetical protein
MGFFKDLFGPPQPCDLCQLGKASWPAARSAAADWKLRGEGLKADFYICPVCYSAIQSAGLQQKSALVAMAALVANGVAERPQLNAYLLHPEWRKTWLHTLDISGIRTTDEFGAIEAMRSFEDALFAKFGIPPRA